jgi:purine-binding chemotaxis protein CheW
VTWVSEPAAEALPRHIVFRAGGERFAVPLEAVREVVLPRPPFARVPRARPGVRGAMNLRGRVVAVVELAGLLALPPDPLGPGEGHVVVLEKGRRGLGLLVSGVLGVEAISAAAGPGVPPPEAAVRGVAEVGGFAVSVLDGDRLEAGAAAIFGGA